MPSSTAPSADALRLTLDLFETGIELMRQNLRRADPHASEHEIDQQLLRWLQDRPGSSRRRVRRLHRAPCRRDHQTQVTPLEAALRRISSDLVGAQVTFALVGGLAVSVRTEPRFTRDADLAVALANDAEAEALINTLRLQEYRIGAVVEQEAVGRLATVRLTRGDDFRAPVVDLLFASSGIEPEVVAEADSLDVLPNMQIRVARIAHLVALKVLSRDDVTRPQDIADLRALLRRASPDDIAHARQSLALIAARGYHRGRDLIAEFADLLLAGPDRGMARG